MEVRLKHQVRAHMQQPQVNPPLLRRLRLLPKQLLLHHLLQALHHRLRHHPDHRLLVEALVLYVYLIHTLNCAALANYSSMISGSASPRALKE